jgi:Predicted hydrolases or acyltransferases (alpha/beta hydrolase superfamily)
MGAAVTGRLVPIDDTSLWVDERGAGYPVLVLHGGPGLDHHEFADYLDPLGNDFRLLLVDLRACGRSERAPEHTWTLERHAQDVIMLARALRLDRYAVLGHSYGAFVALQNAVDYPGMAAQTIVSSGVCSIRFLGPAVQESLKTFEPASLRRQVQASWEREPSVRTPDEFARLMTDQMPFHFADPQDPRIADYLERTKAAIYSPDVLRVSSAEGFGQIDLEDRLGLVTSPTLVMAGRWDRACTVEAAQAIATGVAGAQLTVFERSAHMAFVEEPEAYIDAVRDFLGRHR